MHTFRTMRASVTGCVGLLIGSLLGLAACGGNADGAPEADASDGSGGSTACPDASTAGVAGSNLDAYAKLRTACSLKPDVNRRAGATSINFNIK